MEQHDNNGMLYMIDGNLNKVISHYYHIYNTDGKTVAKQLSPSLELLLVFNFGTPVHISFNNGSAPHVLEKGCAVLGPLRQMLNYELKDGADAIVVNFKLSGFYRLFKVPLNNFDGQTVYDPAEITDKFSFDDLWTGLSNIADIKARLSIISEYLAHYIHEMDDAAQPLIDGEHYFYNPATHPVKAIASDANVSERTVQIRFQKYAGYSPKELLRFLRFKMVIGRLTNTDEATPDIFEIIDTFNYHDQSHLIKDFQHFLGTTPQQFIKDIKGKEFFTVGSGTKSPDII
ncbi:helix-turn-helix domain-containing protein [Flavobacterium sp. RHBU_24]|uniref:helix-turn-helix domain-containing protein n=1 Tax=Flavobacterium sp. RHBU_24 TaxID=3391185 RepID=UPI0039850C06